jgi:6-pyruvoyl-tetrahydropterin synthase related domain
MSLMPPHRPGCRESGEPEQRAFWLGALVLFLISTLLIARQFTNPNFPSCVIDDSVLHMSWVRQFSASLAQGNWLPRWLPDSNGGYGSPIFIFYSPLVYYVTALLHFGTGSVIVAMKLTRFLALFVSGLAMFVYARDLARSKAALVVALVYVALPFHVLDVSYWTLYAEPWAWIWFPLILMFLRQMLDADRWNSRSMRMFAVCYSGLILTHLVSAYMFSFVIVSYAVFRSNWKRVLVTLGRLGSATALGMALAAFFLLPACYEQRFVHIDNITLRPEFNFRNTFLFFPEADFIRNAPFQSRTSVLLQSVAVLQMAWAATGLILILWTGTVTDTIKRELGFAAGVGVSCLFLMSRVSVWVWDWVPGLPQIQFSTRWLSVFSWAVALIGGLSVDFLSKRESQNWLSLLHFTLAFLMVLATAVLIFSACFLSEEHGELARQSVQNAPEYNPRAMPDWKRKEIWPTDPPFTVSEGQARVRIERWESENRSLVVEADTPVQLIIRLFDYPGWTVKDNGVLTTTGVDPRNGSLLLQVSQGHHRIDIRFQPTPWRAGALSLSVVTGTALLGMSLGGAFRKGSRSGPQT